MLAHPSGFACCSTLRICLQMCLSGRVGTWHGWFGLLHRTDIQIFNKQIAIKEFVSNVKIYYLEPEDSCLSSLFKRK